MDEPINKKSIIFLFMGLILIFLFLYKGLVLSGDEYNKEILLFRNSTTTQSILKKTKLGSKDKAKENLISNLTSVIQENENLYLELTSLNNGRKTKELKYVSILESIYNITENNSNITQFNASIITQLKDALKEIKDPKQNEELENISDRLNINTDLLRNITKYN
jgi:hypothetical protein